jgi:hypothetical protein
MFPRKRFEEIEKINQMTRSESHQRKQFRVSRHIFDLKMVIERRPRPDRAEHLWRRKQPDAPIARG